MKSAVMYYGAAQVTEFRRDLPILFVPRRARSPAGQPRD